MVCNDYTIPVTESGRLIATVLRNRTIEHANKRFAPYPQYAGYFDDWVLVRARRDIPARYGRMVALEDDLGIGCLRTMGSGWTVYFPLHPIELSEVYATLTSADIEQIEEVP